jgi:hypothetical protein
LDIFSESFNPLRARIAVLAPLIFLVGEGALRQLAIPR